MSPAHQIQLKIQVSQNFSGYLTSFSKFVFLDYRFAWLPLCQTLSLSPGVTISAYSFFKLSVMGQWARFAASPPLPTSIFWITSHSAWEAWPWTVVCWCWQALDDLKNNVYFFWNTIKVANTMYGFDGTGKQWIFSGRLQNYYITFGLFVRRLTFTSGYFEFTVWHFNRFFRELLKFW